MLHSRGSAPVTSRAIASSGCRPTQRHPPALDRAPLRPFSWSGAPQGSRHARSLVGCWRSSLVPHPRPMGPEKRALEPAPPTTGFFAESPPWPLPTALLASSAYPLRCLRPWPSAAAIPGWPSRPPRPCLSCRLQLLRCTRILRYWLCCPTELGGFWAGLIPQPFSGPPIGAAGIEDRQELIQCCPHRLILGWLSRRQAWWPHGAISRPQKHSTSSGEHLWAPHPTTTGIPWRLNPAPNHPNAHP